MTENISTNYKKEFILHISLYNYYIIRNYYNTNEDVQYVEKLIAINHNIF